MGSPRKPPAMSNSLISGSGLDAKRNNNGSWPHKITTFMGCPRSIGAEVEPAGIWILGHHTVGGANEARLVELVMAWDRKFENVDRIALQHVLQDRPVLHETRRDRFEVLHALVIALND